jgi:uncharacterized cysteine cluster protein YcgN (CxxCxxCC family)
MTNASAFWRRKKLDEMTAREWERLCDGCARCCVHKLLDESTGEIIYTNVACRLLDTETCRCSDYTHRHVRVPDCDTLTPESVPRLDWLPPTCAYRLVAQGCDLPAWHPLVTGDRRSTEAAGMSAHGKVIPETPDGGRVVAEKWMSFHAVRQGG